MRTCVNIVVAACAGLFPAIALAQETQPAATCTSSGQVHV